MTETLSWYFTAGDSPGAGPGSNGSPASEAVTSAVSTLDADMPAAIDRTVRFDDVDHIAFLAIPASFADRTPKAQADGTAPTRLAGPLVFYGTAVKLFAGDPTTLKVQNKHPTERAKVSVLISRKRSP